MNEYHEGNRCPECSVGILEYPKVENCSCHINPPCFACTDNHLECNKCGWEEPPIINEIKYRSLGPVSEQFTTRPSKDLGNGKRIFDWDYDSSSGSTMVYRGYYKGEVTEKDIIDLFGDGTFGHRGPTLFDNGKFVYIKITD